MRVRRYSAIEQGHQPRLYYTPEAGSKRLTLGKRLARWLHTRFRKLPHGRDRIEPGVPSELIGTGYNPPYIPTKKDPA